MRTMFAFTIVVSFAVYGLSLAYGTMSPQAFAQAIHIR